MKKAWVSLTAVVMSLLSRACLSQTAQTASALIEASIAFPYLLSTARLSLLNDPQPGLQKKKGVSMFAHLVFWPWFVGSAYLAGGLVAIRRELVSARGLESRRIELGPVFVAAAPLAVFAV